MFITIPIPLYKFKLTNKHNTEITNRLKENYQLVSNVSIYDYLNNTELLRAFNGLDYTLQVNNLKVSYNTNNRLYYINTFKGLSFIVSNGNIYFIGGELAGIDFITNDTILKYRTYTNQECSYKVNLTAVEVLDFYNLYEQFNTYIDRKFWSSITREQVSTITLKRVVAFFMQYFTYNYPNSSFAVKIGYNKLLIRDCKVKNNDYTLGAVNLSAINRLVFNTSVKIDYITYTTKPNNIPDIIIEPNY